MYSTHRTSIISVLFTKLLVFGDYANCHEIVILAAFCVNKFFVAKEQWKSKKEHGKERDSNVRITCGNVRNSHQSRVSHDECEMHFIYVFQYVYTLVFCTPRHWLICDTVTI